MADIVKYNSNELMVGGIDDFDARDMTLPRLQLVQAQSKIPGALKHLGEWFDLATNTFNAELNGVFFNVGRQRVMFKQPYNSADKALCASNDGKLPRPEFIGHDVGGEWPIPDNCHDCPFAMWGTDANGRSTKPACSELYVYAFLNFDGSPYMVTIRGSGIKEARKLNYVLRSSGMRKLFKIASREENGQQGTYFVPVFVPVADAPQELIDMAVSLKGVGAQAVRQDNYSEPQATSLHAVGEELGGEVVEQDPYPNF